MKKKCMAMMCLGFLLGPVYLFFVTQLSGEKLNQIEVYSKDYKSISSGGKKISSSGNSRFISDHAIELNPSMSPVRFNLIARYAPSGRIVKKKSNYAVSLSGKQGQLFKEEFSVKDEGGKSSEDKIKVTVSGGKKKLSRTIATVDIIKAEEYILSFSRLKPQDVNVTSLQVEVRKNVAKVNWIIAGVGLGLFVLGVVGIVVFSKKKEAGSKEADSEA